MISEIKIKENIKTERIQDVFVYDSIDSTNTEAKRQTSELFRDGRLEPRVLVARQQTAGRGRLGRSFYSPDQKGIYMSYLYFTDRPMKDTVSVTTGAAVAVAEAIERFVDRKMRIKWVNDIYDERGKVCGILAEAVSVAPYTAVIIGVGINIGEGEFPEELRGIASSIGSVEGRESELVAAIVDGLAKIAEDTDHRYMEGYRERFMLEGVEVDLIRADEIVAHGRVLGVDDEGELVFLPDGENETAIIRSGEISVRNFKKE